jgi:hypothetical protein
VDKDIKQNLNPKNEHGVHTMELQMTSYPVTSEPFLNERFFPMKCKFLANRKFRCGFKDNSV